MTDILLKNQCDAPHCSCNITDAAFERNIERMAEQYAEYECWVARWEEKYAEEDAITNEMEEEFREVPIYDYTQ